MPAVRTSSATALGKILAIAASAPPPRQSAQKKTALTTVWNLETAINYLTGAFVKSMLRYQSFAKST